MKKLIGDSWESVGFSVRCKCLLNRHVMALI